jgi:hypothetical protein
MAIANSQNARWRTVNGPSELRSIRLTPWRALEGRVGFEPTTSRLKEPVGAAAEVRQRPGLSVKGELWAGLRPPPFAGEDASEAATSRSPGHHLGGSTGVKPTLYG